MSTIKINIVSSNEEIYSGEATMVYATGTLGELGIAPGHTPLLTGCSGGFLEVQPDLVTVLSDTAERADSLDEAEAIKAKESAEQDLANKDATLDHAKASAQLAEAVARLKTIQKLRKNQ